MPKRILQGTVVSDAADIVASTETTNHSFTMDNFMTFARSLVE